GSHTAGLRKKLAAGVDVALEVEEARQLLAEALERIRDDTPDVGVMLASILRTVGHPQQRRAQAPRSAQGPGREATLHPVPEADQSVVADLLSENVADVMQEVDSRAFETSSPVFPLRVERRETQF